MCSDEPNPHGTKSRIPMGMTTEIAIPIKTDLILLHLKENTTFSKSPFAFI